MPEVVFDIDEHQAVLSEHEATAVAEKLRSYAAGLYPTDELIGADPEWLSGARAMADVIEDVLTGTREGPIPLDRHGRAAVALRHVLRLIPVTSPEGSTRYARLHAALTQ